MTAFSHLTVYFAEASTTPEGRELNFERCPISVIASRVCGQEDALECPPSADQWLAAKRTEDRII